MSSVGNIYIEKDSNKKYECIATITVSPTLINKNELKHNYYQFIAAGTGEVIEIEPKTIILKDEDGNEFVAVLVDEEVDFTATANDIREGKVAVTDDGVTIGDKFIPSYYTSEGLSLITPGSVFAIKIADNDLYDYTKLQAIVCPFNSTVNDSVSCERVAIDDNLYEVLSTVSIGELQRNSENKTIELGFTNTTSSLYLIRYFTYKEVI